MARDYVELNDDTQKDSRYLRETGLIPNVLALAGDCDSKAVLDVGCGTGWLLEQLPHGLGSMQCDVADHPHRQDAAPFTIQDIRQLSLPNARFDIVVASLVLIYVRELDRALAELQRVTKPGGGLVVVIMNPAAYRTGRVTDEGFCITEKVSEPRKFDLMIAGEVGPFFYYHRTLSMYVSALAAAGWTLQSMRDWTVNLEDYRAAVDSPRPDRHDRLPMFTFFRCRKGGL